ncbi:LacI family DNA-binding transcriptional regulator [Paenarthrobacter sp. NyZ202]|uniref:LacI family DNA-binding transcriptional regulator n=1 Tax=Paenarthrobacter sp. NyZ202 TaxID=3402689 RepID=UPI003CF478D2
MVTSRDVARRAGVSQPTVSRVLNGVTTVAPEIRDRVLAALEETGYVPNAQAKAMRAGRSGAIGVVTSEIQNPFLPYLVDAITGAARERDLTTVVWNDPDPSNPMAVAGAASGIVDGVLVTAARRDIHGVMTMAQRGFPVLLCNRAPEEAPVDVVTSDHFGSAAASATYLVEHGHRDIAAVFGPPDTFASPARQKGFRQSLLAHGVHLPDNRVFSGATSYESGYRAVRSLFDGGLPDSIFCSSDIIAYGVLDALAEAGVKVPNDVWVCGIDGLPMSGWRSFDLTTHAQDIPHIAAQAVDALAARIGGSRTKPVRLELPTTLVVRGSTNHAK